ncbi:hypothetical protein SAMN02949497_3279 [Methylomagnum ishizawai]|uniref:Uncharacterized protein n=1 Tax=Methylomagnum ishizawai TaxID=1760988 RepID=A0A1Y6D5S7_9GAMM|nr:hypothetical protein [Methylomagnum ishizawai]SMF95902.1 hypothetical protein SAMN02949497_3279 [Methylomagnum ishizawai]
MAENNQNDGKFGFPFANLGSVLALVLAGTLFIGQTPYNQSRPNGPDIQSKPSEPLHEVEARLWQDPFEAAEAHEVRDKDKDKDGHDDHFGHDLKALTQEIQNKLDAREQPQGEQKVIAVMLPDGHYFEEAETRRRLRYAVLSGFDAAKRYQSDEPEHIHYVYFSLGKDKESKAIYEWMTYKPVGEHENRPPAKNEELKEISKPDHPSILVLWLNQKDFKITPYQNLISLFEKIVQSDLFTLNIAVLGPKDSEGLQDLTNEVLTSANLDRKSSFDNLSCKKPNHNNRLAFSFYSPAATAQENILLKAIGDNHNLSEYFENCEDKIRFIRTTPTDEALGRTLKMELALRGVQSNPRNHIVLLSEWDTLYSWHLPRTFAQLLNNKDSGCTKALNLEQMAGSDCIHLFRYLRGLDGEKRQDKSDGKPDKAKDKKNSGTTSAESRENMEDADGNSQFDYVRRLAQKIKILDGHWRSEGKGSLQAVGILGSDVYDKLLILEAMHDLFPDVLFFTNDMDARYLHPSQNQWARNLIVVSGFGLELEAGLQKDIPPFRSSLQTAYFLATQAALNDPGISQKAISKALSDKGARIFEIGRTMEFHLNEPQKIGEPCQDIKNCDNIHATPKNLGLHLAWQTWLLEFLSFTIPLTFLYTLPTARNFMGQLIGVLFSIHIAIYILLCLLLAESIPLIAIVLTASLAISILSSINRNTPPKTNKRFTHITTFIFSYLIIYSAIILVFVQAGRITEEPFAFTEGVSMWPTELLRLIAWILASYSIIDSCQFSERMKTWIINKAGKRNYEHHLNPDDQGACSANNPKKDPLVNWLQWNTSKCRLSRAFLFAALFYFVCYLIIQIHEPNIPYRGENIKTIDQTLLLGLLVPSFSLLLFLVTDAAQTATQLIEAIAKSEHLTQWPPFAWKAFVEEIKIPQDNLHEWISVHFVGKLTEEINTIMAYPFLVLVLMVLARSSYFDHWVTPLGLKLVIGASAAYLLYCDYRLKKAADAACKNALKCLNRRIIQYKGEKNDPLVGQLEYLVPLIQQCNQGAFRPFTQRPIFLSSLPLLAAMAVDFTDNLPLLIKLFGFG